MKSEFHEIVISNKQTVIYKRELGILIICMLLLGAILGNLWGSTAVRTTVERTQTFAVPGILIDIQELEKDIDDLHKAIFGVAKPIKK